MSAPIRQEAGRAVRGSLCVGGGQVINSIIGLLAVMLIPRTFGTQDYGHWVLWRSIASLLVGLSVMGTPEIMARFYVIPLAEGRWEDAGRIFKAVVLVRLFFFSVAAFAGFWMVLGADYSFSNMQNAGWLALSIVFQGWGMTFMLLLYGERRLFQVALLNVLQAALAPLAILLAYHCEKGFLLVPMGAVCGDAIWMLIAFLLARPGQAWVKGWPSGAEMAQLMAFGGLVAVSSVALNLFSNLLPYVMSLRGYSVEAIGFIGLSTRLTGMVTLALATIGAGLFPSLAYVMQRHGTDRAVKWQNLCTRLGVVCGLLIVGAFWLLGRFLVPLVFGLSFAKAIPVLSVGFMTVVPFWLGGQMGRTALLIKQPRMYVISTLGLYVAFMAIFWGLPVDVRGLNAAGAVLGASVFYAICFAVQLRALHIRLQDVARFLPACLMTLFALLFSRLLATPGQMAVGGVVWVLLFLASIHGFGAVRYYELSEIAHMISRREPDA